MTKAAELAKMGEVLTNSQIGGRRNIIINGAMQVAQRGTSATGLGSSNGAVVNTVDRMNLTFVGSTAGRITSEQVADVHDGFANALKLSCTTADTSIGADEAVLIQYKIEGQDLQQLKKGTSDAEKVTVSFYVKANTSATYTLELEDIDNSRFNSQEFSVTTDWTRVTKTFAADTTGSLDDDNGHSLNINIWLHAGSTYTGGTHVSDTWGTTTNIRASDNQTSILDATSRTFFLTGLQMEVGSQATPFEHRSFGEELALCQRYFQSFTDNGSGGGYITNGTIISARFYGTFRYQKRMRAIPSSFTFTSGGFNVQSDALSVGSQSIDETHNPTIDSVRFRTNLNTNFTNAQGAILRYDTGTIDIDAEL
jgi:hypothetical protein